MCIAGTPGTGAVDPGDAGAVCGDYQRIKHIAAVRFWNMQILRRYSEDKHFMLSCELAPCVLRTLAGALMNSSAETAGWKRNKVSKFE